MYARKEHQALRQQQQENTEHVFPPVGLFSDTFYHMNLSHYRCSHAMAALPVSYLRALKNQYMQDRKEHEGARCHITAHCP